MENALVIFLKMIIFPLPLLEVNCDFFFFFSFLAVDCKELVGFLEAKPSRVWGSP